MPLREYEAVAIRPFRIFRVDIQFLKIKISVQIRRGKRAARMAGLCMLDTLYRSQPDLTGRNLKAFLLTAIHSSRPPNIILNFIKGFFLCGKSLKLTDEKYLREISPLQTFGL